MLALPVEESRAARQQRQQSRFRDRGGIFVPPEKNAFVDFLLARTVTGESPSKRDGLRSRQSSSPVRDKDKDKAADLEMEQLGPDETTPGGDNIKQTRRTPKQSRKSNATENDGSEDRQPIAGPSRLEVVEKLKPPAKGSRSAKSKTKKADVDIKVNLVDAIAPAPKRKGRPPKAKATEKVCEDEPELPTAQPKPKSKPRSTKPKKPPQSTKPGGAEEPAARRRGRPPKVTQAAVSATDIPDEAPTATAVPAKVVSEKTPRKRQRDPPSDDDNHEVSSDYMPASHKRAKTTGSVVSKPTVKRVVAKTASAKPVDPITTKPARKAPARKKKPAAVAESYDSDASSAIIIKVKKKPVKTDKTVDLRGNDPPPKRQPAAPQASPRQKPTVQKLKKTPHAVVDEDPETVPDVDLSDKDIVVAAKALKPKAKPSRTRPKSPHIDSEPEEDDNPTTESKSKSKPRQATQKAKAYHPESEDEEAAAEEQVMAAPSKSSTRKGRPKATVAKATAKPGKRSREIDDQEGGTCAPEDPPPPRRKRAKVVAVPEPDFDDETVVAQVVSKNARPGKAATSKASKPATKVKQSAANPPQPKTHKGLPPEILNRLNARPPPSSPRAESDADPIDFLS